MKETSKTMRFSSTQKLTRKRAMHLSKREKTQLVILAVAMIIVVPVAMILGVRTAHG